MAKRKSTSGQASARLVLRHLNLNERNRHLVHDVICGLHSGFPLCCIAFYLTVWQPFLEECREISGEKYFIPKTNEYYRNLIDKLGDRSVGYVMCPSCLLAGNVIDVKPCECIVAPRLTNTLTLN